jgi:hypothetical protein
MLVAADIRLRLLGERIERMLHLRHHVLQDSIAHVADEQVMLRMALRDQSGANRGIAFHFATFGVSGTICQVSGYQEQFGASPAGFGVLGTTGSNSGF